MRTMISMLLVAGPVLLDGAVLPGPELAGLSDWYFPDGAAGVVVEEGKRVTTEMVVPPLWDHERERGGNWRGVVSLDVYGTSGATPGHFRVEAVDPATGTVLASANAGARNPAPRAEWAVIASSEHPGAEAEKVFDDDPGTIWHSRYGQDGAQGPHWIGLSFAKAKMISEIRVLPRQGGGANGVAKEWRMEGRRVGGEWKTLAEGTTDQGAVAKSREAFSIRLAEPVELESIRVVIESDWSGGGFGSAAEIFLPEVNLGPRPDGPAAEPESCAWLEVPGDLMEKLEGKSFGLVMTSTDGGVVVGPPRWCRVPDAPDGRFLGRSNGGLGPDKLGAGLLGFDALTEHQQSVLTLMSVRKGSPADKAGLEAGSMIVSVAGNPLPANDLRPGWGWLRQSHEAVLGRATEEAIAAGKESLEIGVLREGEVERVAVRLERGRVFTTMDPVDDPEAAALLADLLKWVTENQREDGSWSGDIIRTTFAALALLATEEKKYEGKVKRAVDWALAKYPEPAKYGNLGFWHGAYTGILYSEWYLRTGDRRVLAPLSELRDWVVAGQHESIWEVPALGHGPSGLPYGEKALVAPACHLLVYEALARRCGMESGIWEMIGPYMEKAWSDPAQGGHGGLGYNRSYKDTAEAWSRSGLFAMSCHLRGERPEMRDAMTGFMHQYHPWLRNSHAYGEPGGAWGLLGLNLAAPDRYREVVKEYAWWFSLAWEPGYGLRFTTPHMGAPYMGEDDLINPAYALVLQGPRRSLHLTGREESGSAGR